VVLAHSLRPHRIDTIEPEVMRASLRLAPPPNLPRTWAVWSGMMSAQAFHAGDVNQVVAAIGRRPGNWLPPRTASSSRPLQIPIEGDLDEGHRTKRPARIDLRPHQRRAEFLAIDLERAGADVLQERLPGRLAHQFLAARPIAADQPGLLAGNEGCADIHSGPDRPCARQIRRRGYPQRCPASPQASSSSIRCRRSEDAQEPRLFPTTPACSPLPAASC